MIQLRTLDQVHNDINHLANEWHQLLARLHAGERVIAEVADVERDLDRLYAEKRWLKAGGIVPEDEMTTEVRRVNAILRQTRFAGVDSYA